MWFVEIVVCMLCAGNKTVSTDQPMLWVQLTHNIVPPTIKNKIKQKNCLNCEWVWLNVCFFSPATNWWIIVGVTPPPPSTRQYQYPLWAETREEQVQDAGGLVGGYCCPLVAISSYCRPTRSDNHWSSFPSVICCKHIQWIVIWIFLIITSICNLTCYNPLRKTLKWHLHTTYLEINLCE